MDRSATGVLQDVLDTMHRYGVPAWINYGAVESAANVLLFVPFGLLAGLLLPRRRRWLALAGAVLLSAGIELAQSSLLPERFGTVQDVRPTPWGPPWAPPPASCPGRCGHSDADRPATAEVPPVTSAAAAADRRLNLEP